jgi:hypothetical protein
MKIYKRYLKYIYIKHEDNEYLKISIQISLLKEKNKSCKRKYLKTNFSIENKNKIWDICKKKNYCH